MHEKEKSCLNFKLPALYSLSLPTFYLNLIQTRREHLDLTGHVENVNILIRN